MVDTIPTIGRTLRQASGGGHLERVGKYPKDGDLCVARVKPEETLVEARSDSDVQIDRLSCV